MSMHKTAALARRMGTALKKVGREDAGQGTVEYAILVGVLVVIAIAAIVLFRDKVTSLWGSISEGINGL